MEHTNLLNELNTSVLNRSVIKDQVLKGQILLVLYIILVSSGGGLFLGNLYFLLAVTLIVFITLVVNNKLKVFIFNGIFFLFLLILVYSVGSIAVFEHKPNFAFMTRFVLVFFLVLLVLAYLEDKFLITFEKVLFPLVIISLFIFSLQIVNFSFVFAAARNFKDTFGISESLYMQSRLINVNAIIYTINQDSATDFLSHRNCGFAFEPGFYSFFLNLGIITRLFKNKFRFDTRVYIYILTLITTQSTTGIIVLFIIVGYILFTTRKITIPQRIIYAIASIGIVVLFANSEFGFTKVFDEKALSLEYESKLKLANKYSEHSTTLGRYGGLKFAIDRVVDNSPIIGFVGMDRLGFDEEMISTIGIPSGTALIIYYFGFLGLVLFFYGSYVSSRKLSMLELGTSSPYLIFAVFNIYVFAFPFISSVLFFYLVLYNLKPDSIHKNKNL